MIAAIKQAVDRSVFLTSLNYLKGQLLYQAGLSDHLSGSTHARLTPDQGADYVEQVVADYLHFAGVPTDYLAGKDVLEIGPGDNLGVALSLVAKGARSVTCLDGFRPRTDDSKNTLIYGLLIRGMNEAERERLEGVVSFEKNGHASFAQGTISCMYGVPIEQAAARLGGARFDLIISRAVLEHVRDLEAGWSAMVRLLSPAGEMWHKVDFRNHGKYEQFHPLFFLAFSDRVWNLITSPDPTLNRERLSTYLRLAHESFGLVKCYATHVLEGAELRPHPERLEFGRDYGAVERELVANIRPRLSARFRSMSDEELLTSGIFLICRDRRR
jgi:hypothetical protein